MRFVVTGGAGFIGRNIVKKLTDNNHCVDVIDNLHVGNTSFLKDNSENVNFFNIDIRKKEELNQILNNCDGIFHEAALTSVPESFLKTKKYNEVNVLGTKNIFDIAQENNIRVVFASSSSVYGDTADIPIKESNPTIPISPYGQTKIECEKMAEDYSKKELEVIGLRYFNAYGKGQNLNYAGVILKFLEKIKAKKPLNIFGDGLQTRDFIHVEDIAMANLAAMNDNIKSGFFNIGTGKSTSINELAKIMIDISGHKREISYSEPLDGDIKLSVADMTKTYEIFQWKASVRLEEGLKGLIKDYLDSFKSSS